MKGTTAAAIAIWVALLLGPALGVRPSKAEPIASGLTVQNFGERLEVTLALIYPGAGIAVEQRACQKKEGGVVWTCDYDVAGTPMQATANKQQGGEVDYINIFTVLGDADGTVRLVDLTLITALMLGLPDQDAADLHAGVKRAAMQGKGFVVQTDLFSFVLTPSSGALFAVFTARN